jgi:hypothetical protein
MKTDKEYIVCSAVWFKEILLGNEEIGGASLPKNCDKGLVFCGLRHHNCIYTMGGITGLKESETGERVQGFLTNKNRFVDRIEGADIAIKAGQIESLKWGKQLYSEDLW